MIEFRPEYHYQPKQNWMNDPNGLIHYRGLYHLFYQYNPNGDQWGDIHWGHAVSKDLFQWETRPIAMAPRVDQGELHCFSGCAYKGKDGKPLFFYTSVGADDANRGCKEGAEQWLATASDDLNTLTQGQKHAMKLTMHGGMQLQEWRDPYVIPYQDGFLMVLGCRLEDGHGACLLYTSENGLDFTYHSVLVRSDNEADYTWECPIFFELDGHYVLIYSPCREPLYMIGDLDDKLHFTPFAQGTLDMSGWEGFYAPQSFEDEMGRRIVFGWMTDSSRGDWAGIKGWSGCQSLPREMYIENNTLKMRVISQVDQYLNKQQEGELPLLMAAAGAQYMLEIDAEMTDAGTVEIDLLCNGDATLTTKLRIDAKGQMQLIREHSTDFEGVHRSTLVRSIAPMHGKAHIQVYVDHSVMEASCNGEWISTRVYPSSEDCIGIRAEAKNATAHYALYALQLS